jgi:hypothetical protein
MKEVTQRTVVKRKDGMPQQFQYVKQGGFHNEEIGEA